jgi:hypothetical protein
MDHTRRSAKPTKASRQTIGMEGIPLGRVLRFGGIALLVLPSDGPELNDN